MTAKGKEQCEELRRLWAHLEVSKVFTYYYMVITIMIDL